jgi:hypothetical protein
MSLVVILGHARQLEGLAEEGEIGMKIFEEKKTRELLAHLPLCQLNGKN